MAMQTATNTFLLPDLGEGLQEAEIVAWEVSAGDHVVADQPLVSVETDKAVVEIPSPQSGRIAVLHGGVGDIIEVGAPIVEFEGDGPPLKEAGGIVGDVPTDTDVEVKEEHGVDVKAPGAKVKATPAVRAIARKLDVDLSHVRPSGAGGTITKADIERVAKTLERAGPLEELRGVRRSMARNMTLSGAQVVPATIHEEADVDAWGKESNPTVRLVRAIVAGCKAEGALNAWYDSAREGRRVSPVVDLGIAVDTGDGLFVPVLRDVASRDDEDLRKGLDALVTAVKARKVPAEELRGQTITLSNYGTLVGRFGNLVVVPPQVAILGAGRIAERVVAVDGQIVVRRMLPLSLTFDHRVVSGGEAARFLAGVIADLEASK